MSGSLQAEEEEGKKMTIIILQCEDKTDLVLAVNTETKELMAFCPKCRKLFDISEVDINDEELERVVKSMRDIPKGEGETLFYLRCGHDQLGHWLGVSKMGTGL